jgi:predicted tellurium resistance membrane protein TerC
MVFMMFFSDFIAVFVHKYQGIKMLALCFLIAIGVLLILEGLDFHVEKGYIYFAMFFSLAVETLNIRARKLQNRKHANIIFNTKVDLTKHSGWWHRNTDEVKL